MIRPVRRTSAPAQPGSAASDSARLHLLPRVLGGRAELDQRGAAGLGAVLGEGARLDRRLVGAQLRMLGHLGGARASTCRS